MLYCCIFFTLEYTVAFQPFFFLIAIKLNIIDTIDNAYNTRIFQPLISIWFNSNMNSFV